MLAARFRQSVVTATIGGSISVPVLNTPMPPLRWWRNDPLEVATRHDTHILAVVNTVLKRENLPPLQAMKELWQTDENFLCTLPPLDYGAHMGQPRRCRGILKHTDGGTEPVWPGEGRERVFAYLRPGMAHFDVILQALKSLCLCSLIVAPGISAELEAQYSSGCLKISGLVNMSAVCGQASLIIGNGSLSITAQALQHGIPSFMSPVFLEHRMNAVGAYLSGASMMIEPNPTVEGVARQLERILLEPGFRKAAVACSQLPEVRRSAAEVAEEVTQQCIDLVEQKL
jgi:hypothetical protein